MTKQEFIPQPDDKAILLVNVYYTESGYGGIIL